MIWFEQKILTVKDISEKIDYLINNNDYLLIILIISIFITTIFINYVFPILHMIKAHIIKENRKKNRKNMIKQIAFQKEIEEEIEKEL